MKRIKAGSTMGIVSAAVLFGWVTAASAQTFNSGSNGSLGAFAPTTNTTVILPSDGILNYTAVNIPAGVTIAFAPNAANTPVTMLATGDVVVAGTINLNGVSGLAPDQSIGTPSLNAGGRGGPGGFAGGGGGTRGLANTFGAAGLGPGGGPPVSFNNGGTYGAPSTFVSLLPLFGGSGGGAENADATWSGGSGSGGGGAMVIASTTKITVMGAIIANGGNAASGASPLCGSHGYLGPGSGGAIRLVAPELTNTGTIQARMGGDSQCGGSTSTGAAGGAGRIRIEGLVFGPIAATDPAASVATSLGPITAGSVPALVNLPTLAVASIGGIASPINPGGSYTVADVTLPPTTTNPVSVILTATNTPVPTPYTIRLIPRFGNPTSQALNSTGSFAISTATANVTFPNGVISGLQAFAGFTLTAALAPIIDGELADQVLLAAGYGEPSTLTLVTKSGKEVPVSELSQADQLKVAMAFEALRNEAR